MPEPAVVEKPVEPVKTVLVEEPKPVVAAEPAKVAEPVKAAEPIKYDVKAPEKGVTQKEIDSILAQAKEKGWSNEVAQTLVDAKAESVKAALAEYQTREVERIKGEAPKWLEQLKTDKEIGGDKFNESIENAKRVVNKYGDTEFKEFLNSSGLGNHPMVARMFAKIGKAFGEDHWREGSPIVVKTDKSAAATLYDKTPK